MSDDTKQTESLLIDARQLAKLLSVSVATVWRMRSSGRLPEALMLSAGCVRWRRSELLQWIRNGWRSNAVVEGQAANPEKT